MNKAPPVDQHLARLNLALREEYRERVAIILADIENPTEEQIQAAKDYAFQLCVAKAGKTAMRPEDAP